MTDYYEVAPAYGRSYSTIEQARTDWRNGLDFRVTSSPQLRDIGRYTSKRDFGTTGVGYVIHIRTKGDRIQTLAASADQTRPLRLPRK